MPERDISSLGVMGLGGWTWPEIPPPSSPPPSPSSPGDWLRHWIGCAAGLAAPLDWLRRWIGGAAGLAAPLDCFRYTGLILHADRKSNGRDGKSNGKDMQEYVTIIRVCWDYKSMLGL